MAIEALMKRASINEIMKRQEYVASSLKTECFERKEMREGGENKCAKNGLGRQAGALL